MVGIGAAARVGGPHDSDRLSALRERIRAATVRAEPDAVKELLGQLAPFEGRLEGGKSRARPWVEAARADKRARPFVDSLLEQFPLDSAQGKALMSLAEALLRTPDPKRADQLISERLAAIRGAGATGSDDLLLRTGFALLGSASRLLPEVAAELSGRFSLASVTKPLVAPVVRKTLRSAMQMLGEAFIVGETIESALARGQSNPNLALCSFDVLGEGARTDADAQRYSDSYAAAIDALSAQPEGSVHGRSSISVKLSALEPRYTLLQSARVSERLVPRMLDLARRAAKAGIGLTIDAEEADRLDLSLDIVDAIARDPQTRAWNGLGLAIQAYGRRAPLVIDWIAELARESGRRMTIRLVKGAYWDSEIKRAQERGLASFPVYTSKAATDASYLVCAQHLFAACDVIHPQFATHNAYTIAAVLDFAPAGAAYEFQRLHGMGELLYAAVQADVANFPAVRVYAPVGTHEDLLPYLVRRLLGNGANPSFVHQFPTPQIPVEQVVTDPISVLSQPATGAPARIREPHALYGAERVNLDGADWGVPAGIAQLEAELRASAPAGAVGGPIIAGRVVSDAATAVVSPANLLETVGMSRDATDAEIIEAMDIASRAQPNWDATPAEQRAACLDRAAELLEERRGLFLRLLVKEAGKTLPDAVAELREAIDFCRYYGARGRELFSKPEELRGPSGERNLLWLQGRGVFVCISPWNFPLAIFTGQVVAALMAGNS